MTVTERVATYGDKVSFRWGHGPVSLGWALNAFVVSWSAPNAKDLLISRCWEGVYLYPSANLADADISRPPVQVCGEVVYQTFGFPVDWNRDGTDDLLLTDRPGFIYYAERRGQYPNLSFELLGPLRDADTNLPFNIPWENPHYAQLDDLGGYFDAHFFNYPYIVRYPLHDGDKGVHLLMGDWAGNLWWLPDESGGDGPPVYRGLPYSKPNISKRYARRYLDQYGTEYVKPAAKISDENGAPFLLGDGVDGPNHFPGGDTRPVLYYNRQTGVYDLLVMAGSVRNQLFYLQRTNPGRDEQPVFKNLGEVTLSGGVDLQNMGITSYYSTPVVHEADGWNEMLLTAGCKLAVFRNKRLPQTKPEFVFDRWISGPDAEAYGYMFTDILKDEQGNRYLLDVTGREWILYPLHQTADGIRLSPAALPLHDQHGPFRVDGETDPQGGKNWGFHRTNRWDFDGSGRQHLIVGTDKGLLYLLVDEGHQGRDGRFTFRSVGPLKDRTGRVIKIHNRACPAAIDLNGDGRADLVVGGSSYQLGIGLDPNPGAGWYYLLYHGLDADGVPILDPPQPLTVEGCDVSVPQNSHVHAQSLDVDGDGATEVILAVAHDQWKGKVCRATAGRVGLTYTGTALPRFVIDEYLLDVDDDGVLEHVFAGGENGVGHYEKMTF